jgi:sedoheptulokinase
MISLGIDIGTTKVAMVIVDVESNSIIAQESQVFGGINSDFDGTSEEAVETILNRLDLCAKKFERELMQSVDSIGVTGQMHGIVLRNSKKGYVSNLVTWQDQRCLRNNFIEELREQVGDPRLFTGYGLATMAWFKKYQPKVLAGYDQAGTIQDLLVSYLCDSEKIVMDPTNAASWGLFNVAKHNWNYDSLAKLQVPDGLVPQIAACGSQAGVLGRAYARRWRLKPGLPVMLAIGDNQASLFCTIREPQTELALTLGTSGQLSSIVNQLPKDSSSWRTAEVRPFVDEKYAVVAASLCGGSALGWLTHVVDSWCRDLGLEPPTKDEIYTRFNKLSREAEPKGGLSIRPNFLGERFDSQLKGQIAGIDFSNFSLGEVFAALAGGVVRNLHSMLPEEAFEGKTRLVGSGNGLRRFAIFSDVIPEIFGLPLTLLPEREEAACGAALLSGRLVG